MTMTKFRSDWDPNSPIETLINQFETCQEFATDGNDPYPESTILNNAYNLVYKSGMFFEDCEKWMDQPHHQQDMGQLQHPPL